MPEPSPPPLRASGALEGETDPLLRDDTAGAAGSTAAIGSGGVGATQSISNPLRWMETANSFEGGAFDWVEKDSGDAVN